MGDGATSSRQVMAVLSSQGRGDGGTLPSLFNNGTAGNKTDVQVEQLQLRASVDTGSLRAHTTPVHPLSSEPLLRFMSDLKLQTQTRHSQEGVQTRSVRHADQSLQYNLGLRGTTDMNNPQNEQQTEKKVTNNLLHRIIALNMRAPPEKN